MTFTEYKALNPFQRFWYNFVNFIKSIPSGIVKFFCTIGRTIKKIVFGIGKGFRNFFMGFIRGDIFTKISYFIMGFGNICRGQYVKGIVFFALEVAYVAFMIFFGVPYLKLFGTLSYQYHYEPGKITPLGQDDPRLVVDEYSYTILLYGILSIVVCIAFFALYIISTKSAVKCGEMKRAGLRPATFREESHDLLDKKFHTTLLTTPIILITVFVIVPLIFMILMAFTSFSGTSYDNFTWVGFANFQEIFKTTGGSSAAASMGETFLRVTIWTLVWAVAATFSNYILGMIFALMINKKGIKLKKLWRTLFVMTIAVPQFVTLMLMAKMLGADYNSPVNLLMDMFGAPHVDLLHDGANNGLIPRITVIIVNCWVGIPYTILMTSGILMNIPEDLYESARIDGAGPVKSFMKITLPYMLFVTAPYLITTFVGNINNFNVIYLLTGGEPKNNLLYAKGAGSTDLLITLLFKLSVDKRYYGLGAAIGILVFLVSATVSLITFNMTKSAKSEEEFS